MLVVPLAEVDVKDPGVMEMLVAPVDDQLNALLVPEVMLVGLAVKLLIAGTVPVPPPVFVEFDTLPQLVSQPHASRATDSAQRFRLPSLRPRGPN